MKNILHIIHPWGGGISTYIDDLRQASGNTYSIITMKCWQGIVNVTHEENGELVEKEYYHGEDLGLTDYTNKKYSRLLAGILEKYRISIVHIDSHVGHTFDIFRVPKSKNIPIVCAIHDYFYICPTFHLVDKNGDYCNVCRIGEENHNCITHHDYLYSKFDGFDLRQFREKFCSFMRNVDVYIFPSAAAKNLFAKYYKIEEAKCSVIYHGTSLHKNKHYISPKHNRNLRVGILGSMLKHKGKESINTILDSLENYPVEFFHFGDGDLSGGNLSALGRYDRYKIVSQLQFKQIDVILLLSTWPETFSYTLTESIAANIPVIATNMGALAERVSRYEMGWLVDYRDMNGICELILRLASNTGEIERYKRKISNISLKTTNDMICEYDHLYDDILASDKYKKNKFMSDWDDGNLSEGMKEVFMGGMVQLTLIKTKQGIYRAKNKLIKYMSKA